MREIARVSTGWVVEVVSLESLNSIANADRVWEKEKHKMYEWEAKKENIKGANDKC